MEKLYKGLIVLAVVLGLSALIVALNVSGGNLAGDTNFDSVDTTDGYKVDGTAVIDGDGNYDGAITATIGTFSSTLDVEGIASVSGSTSTLKIGDDSTGLAAGCLVLGDSGGATSTPVYITATGATISATTTQPAACQ